jgi:CelD/BcsL family acetyltransferase involved in cellulose biosynthesis
VDERTLVRFRHAAALPCVQNGASATCGGGKSEPASQQMELIDPLVNGEWDELVATHPDATIFHGSAWARVLHRSYGHRPTYLRFFQAGQTEALVPLMEVSSRLTGRRGVCLPFSDFCGPLYFPEADVPSVLDRLETLAGQRKWKHLELRAVLPGGVAGSSSASPITYYGHDLKLRRDTESLWQGCSASVRRALRKARRGGLKGETSRSPEAFRAFLRLHARTRRRHGLPPQPDSFFRAIFEEIIEPGLGFVALARKDSQAVAASVFFHFGDKGLYKFGASDETQWELRPNQVAMWEGICSLATRGIKRLHFGRTGPHQDGLRQFKKSWGAEEGVIGYTQFNTRKKLWQPVAAEPGGFHQTVFGHLPLTLNRLAGAIIYPHLD